ncbi:E3 ubiquitin- ligase Mdm2-like [Chlorella sorokiniana]|uniref:E3 ubiquitin-ligase Mdm2-like n=1 Tax=Chlorella sorokiniana TaxID=3076 RepID=A0A2P6TH93_CHLSO|nr:E3 ubiquitin- ligase Mdm2-like [Chlorella sorokiniana]|eukprot:PRW33662.1 E3 ubiquitin- ligase Mdm2-like [Chlorella sorokiniana]
MRIGVVAWAGRTPSAATLRVFGGSLDTGGRRFFSLPSPCTQQWGHIVCIASNEVSSRDPSVQLHTSRDGKVLELTYPCRTGNLVGAGIDFTCTELSVDHPTDRAAPALPPQPLILCAALLMAEAESDLGRDHCWIVAKSVLLDSPASEPEALLEQVAAAAAAALARGQASGCLPLAEHKALCILLNKRWRCSLQDIVASFEERFAEFRDLLPAARDSSSDAGSSRGGSSSRGSGSSSDDEDDLYSGGGGEGRRRRSEGGSSSSREDDSSAPEGGGSGGREGGSGGGGREGGGSSGSAEQERPTTSAAAGAAAPAAGSPQPGSPRAEQDGEQEDMCIICMERPITHGYLHRGTVHRYLCEECTRRSRQHNQYRCPICKQWIEDIVRVYGP